MKRDAELAVLMIVLFASLFLFDYAYNYSENAVFGSSVTGAVLVYTGSSAGSSNAICTVTGSKVKCSLNGIEYETSGECTRNCKAGLIQEQLTGGSGTSSSASEIASESSVLKCIDSDNGKSYGQKGTVKNNLNQPIIYQYSLVDSCSGSTLNEHYCDANGNAQTAYYNCPNGCSEGACKSSTVEISVNPASPSAGQSVTFAATATGSVSKVKIYVDENNDNYYEKQVECTGKACQLARSYSAGQIVSYYALAYDSSGKGVADTLPTKKFTVPGSVTTTPISEVANSEARNMWQDIHSELAKKLDEGARQAASGQSSISLSIGGGENDRFKILVNSGTSYYDKSYNATYGDTTLYIFGSKAPPFAFQDATRCNLVIKSGDLKTEYVDYGCDGSSEQAMFQNSPDATLDNANYKNTLKSEYEKLLTPLASSATGSGAEQGGSSSSAGSSSGSSSACTVTGSKVKCSLNGIEYETSGECTRNCKAELVQNGAETAVVACAGNGEAQSSVKQCCSGLVPCNFCGNKCYDSCPNTLCKAPYEVSCQSGSDCLSGSCIADSAGNKKCGTATGTGTNQPPSSSTSQQDVCTVVGAKVKCSLNGIEYETSGRCTRNCKPELIQGVTTTPPSDSSGQQGGSSGDTTVSSGVDLVVKLTDFPSRMFWGERYEFKAIITNNGDRSSADAQREGSAGGFNTFLGIVASDGTRYTIGNVPAVRLLPQESLSRSFSWTVPPEMFSGTYKYLAIADDGDRIEEVNKEQNNRDDLKTVEILERPSTSGVDLVIAIKGITDAGNNPVTVLVTGRTYKILLEVENIGDVELPFTSFYSILYFDSDPSTALGRSSIASKQQGSLDFRGAKKVEWYYTWTVPDSILTGEYALEALTDTQNTVKEVDEENNRNVKQITVRKSTGANLMVVSAAAVPGANNVYHVNAKIKNTGDTQVYIGDNAQTAQGGGSGIISFLVTEAKVERNGQVVCQGSSYVYEPILPGAEKDFTIPLKKGNGNCVLERGNYVLDVLVDSTNFIIETDETSDNRVRQPFAFGTGSSLTCPGRVGTDVIIGYRTDDGLYCDASGQLVAEKASGQSCTNSFECQSNFCAAGKCIEESILRRFICSIISC